MAKGGRRWVVKQAVPGRDRIRAWGGSLLGRLMMGYWLPRAPLRLGGERQLRYEAARLRELRAEGEPVPEVARVGSDFLVLEHGGEPLWHRIRHAAFPDLQPILMDVSRDLARFHAAGHWHGGAQLRNYLVADDSDALVRIDFEEPLDEMMPLAARQAMDLYLLVHSVTAFKTPTERELALLCRAVIEAYLQARSPDAGMLAYVERAQAVLNFVERWPVRLFSGTGKDLRRMLLTVAAMDAVMAPGLRRGDSLGNGDRRIEAGR